MPHSHEDGAKADKSSIVSVRLSTTERQHLSERADQCRMALSAFIRACALSSLDESGSASAQSSANLLSSKAPRAKRLSDTERTQIALVLACMGRLADTIRDLQDEPVELGDFDIALGILSREISTTRDQCFTAMRKQP